MIIPNLPVCQGRIQICLVLFLSVVCACGLSAQESAWSLQTKGLYEEALDRAYIEYTEAESKYKNKVLHDTAFANVIETLGTVYYLNGEFEMAVSIRYKVAEVRTKYYRPNSTRSYVRLMDALGDLALNYFYLELYRECEEQLLKMLKLGERYPAGLLDKPYVDYYPYLELAVQLQFIRKVDLADQVHRRGTAFYRDKLLASNKKINTLAAAVLHANDYYFFEQYYYTMVEYLTFCQNEGLFDKLNKLLVEFEDVVRTKMGEGTETHGIWINNMAPFYAQMGRYDYALKVVKRADANIPPKKREKSPHYASVLNNFGIVKWFKHEFDSALFYFQKAQTRSKKGGGLGELAENTIIPSNIAYCHYMIADVAKAKEVQLQAIRNFESKNKLQGKNINNFGWYQIMLMHLGLFYQAEQNYDSAKIYLLQAYRHNQIRQTQRILMARNLGRLFNVMDSVTQAQKVYSDAFGLHESFIQKNFPYFSEKERSELFRDVATTSSAYHDFVLHHAKEGGLAASMYDNVLRTKGIIFKSVRQMHDDVLKSGDPQLLKQYRQWQQLRESLAKSHQTARATDKAAIDALEAEANALEREITKKSSAFSERVSQTTWQTVQQALKAGEAAVEIVQIDDTFENKRHRHYAALIITKTSTNPILVEIHGGDSLDTRFYNNYRNSINSSIDDKISYARYWQPIAKHLGKVTRVYFSPDGVYNKISMRTLKNPKTGKHVADEIEVEPFLSTQDIINRRTTGLSLKDATLFGYPQYDSHKPGTGGQDNSVDSLRFFFKGSKISALPGTELEVKTISESLGKSGITVSAYTGERATEDNVKAVRSPQILHIATHGFFLSDVSQVADDFVGYRRQTLKDNPLLRSGILLAGAQSTIDGNVGGGEDGILTAYEAMNMDLATTELVVLSACETGLGEVKNGEGVYGLQRAFQTAGANGILMSLWKVDDAATQELMTLLYKNLLLTKNIRSAFNMAQKQLRAKFPNPNHWGAFVYLGM